MIRVISANSPARHHESEAVSAEAGLPSGVGLEGLLDDDLNSVDLSGDFRCGTVLVPASPAFRRLGLPLDLACPRFVETREGEQKY